MLQESYLSIFQHLNTFDSERGAFLTWAGRITIHACLKRNRQQSQRPWEGDADPAELQVASPQPTPIALLTDEELLDWLKRMPGDYYLVFNLHAVEGYAHEEIARLLDITPALSRQRLRRARTWLQRRLATQPDNPFSDYLLPPSSAAVASILLALHQTLL